MKTNSVKLRYRYLEGDDAKYALWILHKEGWIRFLRYSLSFPEDDEPLWLPNWRGYEEYRIMQGYQITLNQHQGYILIEPLVL